VFHKKKERNQNSRQSKVFLVSVKNVLAESEVWWMRKGDDEKDG